MKNLYALLFAIVSVITGSNWTAYGQPPPPGGGIPDSCAIAEPITCGSTVTGSTTAATTAGQPGFCDTDLSTAPGVWYTFVGDGSAVTLTTCSPNTDYDTKLGVFEGPCSSLTCVAGDDDDPGCANSGLQSTPVTFTATPGTQYYVYVTGFSSNTGNYELTMTCAVACNITQISAGIQTPCDTSDNTYTQQIRVFYSDAPATGTLDINGQSFPVTSSPQTETLVGLFSDGASVDVTASFSDDPSCTMTTVGVYTAPANCVISCTADFTGFTQTDYCASDAPITLTPEPYGGTFSGPGITDDGDASSFSPSGLPIAIPDNTTPGIDSNIVVAGLGADDLLTSICLEVEHTWVGDVTINLTNPQGTTVTLMNRPGSAGGVGFGCSSDDLLVTIVPGTGNDMEDSCSVGALQAISGTYTAHDGADIASLNAGDPNGNWVISVIDSAGGDTGSLIECTLNFGGTGTFDPVSAGTGTHDITYTLTTCDGCVATTTQTINVIAADATFTYVDNGLTVDFTANSATGTYSWDFGDANTSTMMNPSHTYAADGTYTVTLIVDNNGCADTTSQTITVMDAGVPNDTCAAAISIACGSVTAGTTVGATMVDGPGFCGTSLTTSPGVWYTFVGDGSAVTLDLCNGNTSYDTKLGLFEGPCTSLTCLDGNDDACGLQSSVGPFTTTVGIEYYVYVSGFGGSTGDFELTMTCSAPCAISDVTAGAQTPCDSNDNTYTQEITVTYSDAPVTGTLDINGQSFPITTSPQTETLTGLFSDGAAVDVTASFSDDVACTMTVNGLFTAPTNCTASCTADYTGFTQSDYCASDAPITLTPEPYGGTFSGPGITDDGDASSFSPAGLPIAIPDNTTPGIDSNIVVSGLGADDLLSSICLEVEHTWVGDVTINLTNPQGTTVTLMNRPGSVGGVGFGCSSDDLLVTIVPGTGNDMEDSCAVGATHAITGTFTAHDGADISSLNAGDPNGNWVISVIDSAGGDTGTLLECTLNFGGTGTFDPAAAGAGTHDITYTLTTCEGCVATTTQTININAADASFTYVDNGLTVDFTANSATGTYSWDFGDTNTSTMMNPSHTYAADGTYTVTLIVNDNGCADTTTQVITLGAGSACPGTTELLFEDFSAGQPAGWTFTTTDGGSWTFDDGTNGAGGPPATEPWAVVNDDANDDIGIAVATSSTVDATGFDVEVTFYYDFDAFAADADFFVEFFDGTDWLFVDQANAFSATSTAFCTDDCEGTITLTAPNAAFGNADFQVRWTFNDNGAFSWGLGIDEIAFCGATPSACLITSVTAGTQGPCDPATDTYSQDIIVEYNDAPAAGTLDINGQSFAITASPQTVTLVGLGSDGLPVDVNASFSDNVLCFANETALFTAPSSCFDPCPGNTTLLWENFNGCALPSGWQNNILTGDSAWVIGDNGGVNNIDGSCMAYFDDDVVGFGATPSWVELVTPSVDNSSGDNLQISFDFNYNHIGPDSFYVDVWNGTSWDNVMLLTEDSIGAWNGGPYASAVIPLAGYSNADFQVRFVYNDGGDWAWYVGIDNVAICQIPVGACEITAATAGTQSPCDPATSTYDQEVIIEYTSAPATGDIIVNGQTFPITGSPQTVTFTGLPADGLPVDVDVEFSDDAFCAASFSAVWTAPADCYDPCVGGTSLIWENFNDCQLPAGWSNNILAGDSAWVFGDNAGNNLDGSCMAYFDDDALGGAALPSWVELVTASVDASSGDDMQLSFDFNYNNFIGNDSFYVDVWNGTSWDNVMLLTEDSTGAWTGGPYPTATIPLVGYTNADFQVRFVYNDGGDWAWYVGVDNVALCAFPPTSCEITSVTAGNQTPCDPVTSLYDQEVIVEYTGAPASGDLIVNGQTFAITGSPQTVTFTGLLANGLSNDVSVEFSDNPFCSADFTAVWTAPADCFDPCPGQNTLLWESFNSCLLPAGWSNNILTGSDGWLFTDNGGDNIDGTCMALFDDDALGAGAIPSLVEMVTPVIDASSGSNMVLDFDFNYNHIGADSFYVDVWDGAQWDNVLLITSDSIGSWFTGPPYAHATIPLVGYSNADFQVRFVYNDGGVWAWYVGIDNVSICEVPPTSCSIDGIVADAQGPCDPVTNEYTQDLIITYSSDPGTGTLDVNGESFAITGSPQTVTLTGLDSDGQTVDVSASFSDDIFCVLNIDDLFTAPVTCLPIPINDTCDNAIPIACGDVVIDSTIYASTYEAPAFCGTGLNTAPGMWYSFIGTGDQVTINTCGAATNYDTKLGLFEGPCDSLVCVDGNDDDCGLQSSINNFITTPGVEYLIYVTGFGGATGVFELTIECSAACEISNVTVGTQTPCDPSTNTYTQEVTIEYANPPAAGTLDVNGQQFAITASPQTVTLVDLFPNGLLVDLTVEFSDNGNCSWNLVEAWTAPEDCTPPPCTDPNAVTIFSEDFNDCMEPAGWQNNIITGDTAWLFVDQSPDAFNVGNIDGTCMALFDDDWLGSGAPASHVELVTPTMDLSNYTDVNFAFDFNYNDFTGETFYVDAWDGTSWNNLMTLTGDSIGAWALGPPYPTATFALAGYTNSDFQVRFGYNDNGNWGWYVGIDNIEVCGTPNCPPIPITMSGIDYCVGDDSTLVSVLEPYTSYAWSNSGVGQSQWLDAGNYTVTVTDANGCVDSLNFNVTQIDNPLPPDVTVTGDTVFCEGGMAVLSGPTGFSSYHWNTGSTTQEITVFESGTYTLYVVDSTGCPSATTSINITVNALPVASFSYTLVDLTIDLTNLSLDTDSHEWTFGDGNSDNTEDPVHTYLEGGTYTITLIASNDCGVDTANVTLGIMNIGVEEATGISEFSMYPNPVHEKLIMDLTLIENREMNIEFFDGLGQIVMSEQNELVAGSNKLEFNLGHLAQGVYSVKISDEQFTQVVRLVKR